MKIGALLHGRWIKLAVATVPAAAVLAVVVWSLTDRGHCAYVRADAVSGPNTRAAIDAVLDELVFEKTRAETLVVRTKSYFVATSPEYQQARKLYAQAQRAFNDYTEAMLSSYVTCRNGDLSKTAALATSGERQFLDYVFSLNAPTKGGLASTATDLAKFYQELNKINIAERQELANSFRARIVWEDWDKISS